MSHRMNIQEILDCTEVGCKGNHIQSVASYVKEQGRLATGSSYPYEEAMMACRRGQKSNAIGGQFSVIGWRRVPRGHDNRGHDEKIIATLATHGPVLTGIYLTSEFGAYRVSYQFGPIL